MIDGRAIASAIKDEVTTAAETLRARDVIPTLAVVVPTDDAATAWYVRSIERTAAKVGIDCRTTTITHPTADQLTTVLDELSMDDSVHGIICQTPLPDGLTLADVGAHIAPVKDVDCANPVSLGRLAAGLDTYAPATAAAVVEILRREEVPLNGTEVAVVGRSTVVGKPAALLLLAENATVTVCHSRTKDLAEVCARADVLVAAVGRAALMGAAHVKTGAVVIDVGTNPTDDGGLVGDVDTAAVDGLAESITPVPGGVGPVTTMLLMRHTVDAAIRLNS